MAPSTRFPLPGIPGLFLLLMLALLAVNASAAERCAAPDEQTRHSIVMVEAGASVGSGVVIGDNLILTAAHVVQDSGQVRILGADYRTDGVVLSHQQDPDLALIETKETLPFPALRFARHPRAPHEWVWAMGYPFGRSLVATSGEYKGLWANALYTSASVNFGQSGGGLIVCENGRHVLAGIVRAFGATRVNGKLVRRDDVSVATNIDDVRRFLNSRQVAFTVH